MILGPWKRLRIKESNFYDRRPSRKGPSHTGYIGKRSFTVDSIALNSPLASPGGGGWGRDDGGGYWRYYLLCFSVDSGTMEKVMQS